MSFNGIQEAVDFFAKLLKVNKIKLIILKNKNIITLNFKNVINLEKEIEINLEFEQIKINKDEIYSILLSEINSLKKKLNTKKVKSFDEFDEENNKQLKEYIDKKILKNQIKNIKNYLMKKYMKKKRKLNI